MVKDFTLEELASQAKSDGHPITLVGDNGDIQLLKASRFFSLPLYQLSRVFMFCCFRVIIFFYFINFIKFTFGFFT